MSMMRDLRSAVRPARRRAALPASSPSAALPVAVRPEPPSAIVDCAVYHEGRRTTGLLAPEDALRKVREDGEGFTWIGLHEPSERELAGIAELFGLHPLAVEDAVHAHQRPKLERYENVLFNVFKTLRYVENSPCGPDEPTDALVETGEIMVFTGQDFVITVRHGGHSALGPLRHVLEDDTELLAKGPSAVLHAVADLVVDGYLTVTEALQLDVDDVEFAVFSSDRDPRKPEAGRIYQLKREVLEFKRAVVPLQRPLQRLSERPSRHVHPEVQNYFRDVADHLTRVTDQVASFDDLLNSILQANLAQVSFMQNEDMRKMSAWAAILMVPTMVTGLYGMNFKYMPELQWSFGYPMVVCGIAAVCLLMRRGFKRNGWL
ncbi:magnesium transporter CorA [Mangrovactinospora gilvigrisea]|uniref:Magnesium transporter CorA n=1 Tax=Mangrovactinospora gilvigrisea TaxID=1428644 RepID=A0A1J7C5U0_9ACTN|nr:magnesium and cobalt transport protein CorA [Mangrovactinospora gilvigrisea]OIV36912.1 magnesium transporter CorA [Mangrovactinospora gilvigrisea]